MGLFEESTWGAEKNGKSVVKRLSQKRKEKERKRKSNILNPKTSDPKTKKNKKRNKNKTDFQSFNETREKESPQNVRKVQNSQKQSKKKSLQNNINSPKSSKNVKMEKKFSKTDLKSKRKLKMIQSTESLKKKSVQEQETISQSITPLNVKKRKLPEFEEEVEPITKSKKRKKPKPETNKIPNFTTEKMEKIENSISEGTPKVSKNKKRKNKKKKQNGKFQIQQNLKSPQRQKDDSVKKISINKIQEMIKNKNQEIKGRKLDSSLTLRERMLAHLRSSRFRFINESLYNSESSESKEYFKEDPEAFIAYHEGYRQQVAHWPLNPVDIIIASVKKMPKDYILADFGCGEAKLADSVSQTVHSFDLVAMNDKVKACDMAHTPLLTNGVNAVVFCLSLMGTNLADYLLEANRVLKKGGIMKIAEVESRFDNIENFINLVSSYGFVNTWTDFSNDLFYFLDFKKEKDASKGNKKLPVIELKPCLYKKR